MWSVAIVICWRALCISFYFIRNIKIQPFPALFISLPQRNIPLTPLLYPSLALLPCLSPEKAISSQCFSLNSVMICCILIFLKFYGVERRGRGRVYKNIAYYIILKVCTIFMNSSPPPNKKENNYRQAGADNSRRFNHN